MLTNIIYKTFGISFKYPHRRRLIDKNSRFPVPFQHWKIASGDLVQLIDGKDKGKQGKVLRIDKKSNQVIVEGLNLQKRYISKGQSKKQLIHFPSPINVSKVGLVDPSTGKIGKTQFGYTQDGKKVRVFNKSGVVLPKPINYPSYEERHKERVDSIYDTQPNNTLKVTYKGQDFQKIKQQFQNKIKQKQQRQKMLWFK